ncbi:DUF5058 family protein [Siminovitchia sp. FSL W7-1587]|uniref:DUF5058 family protein n=1 Tax=Siminovitchia sp. FSL W7-1587 TaxID=2954699 RepID=UPI0030D33A90
MTKEVMTAFSTVPLWMIAFTVICIVIFQALMFIRLAKKAAIEVGMTSKEVKTAMKTGLIGSIGPFFSLGIVIISLIALIGSPLTMMRIGIIGSASTEAAAAEIGANAFGSSLGTESFTVEAFSTVVWTMCLGGMGWLLFTFLFTKSLGNVQNKLKAKNPKLMGIVSAAAMMGAFGYLAVEKMVIDISSAVAGFMAIFTLFAVLFFAKKTGKTWLKEWSLAIAMMVGMYSGYLMSLI